MAASRSRPLNRSAAYVNRGAGRTRTLQRDDAPVDPQERRREQEGTRAPAIRAGR